MQLQASCFKPLRTLLDNLLSTGFDVDIDEENSQQNKQNAYNFSRKVIILKTNMKLCVKIMNNGV